MKYLRYLIGIALFGFILYRIDRKAVATYLYSLDFGGYLEALVSLFFLLFLKSVRWKVFLDLQCIRTSWKDSYLMYTTSVLAAVVTPGRLGEIVRVLYLREDGVSTSRAVLSVVADRVLDLIAMSVLALGSLVWLAFALGAGVVEVVAALLGILLGMLFLWRKRRSGGRTLVSLVQRVLPDRLSKAFGEQGRPFAQDILGAQFGSWALLGALTVLFWSAYVLVIYRLTTAMGLELSLWQVAVAFGFSTAATYIPVSIAGIGTRDAVLVALFPFMSTSQQAALAFSFCMFIIYPLSALFGLLSWIIKPPPGWRSRGGRDV